MAYNSGFPIGYSAPYQLQPIQPIQQMQPIQQPPQQQMNGGLTWVQGEAGAKAFPVTPGTTVDLWDSEEQIIYLKSVDMSGMPSMKIIDYTIRDQSNSKNTLSDKSSIDLSGFVTQDEFNNRLNELANKINNLTNNKQSSKNHEYRRNKEKIDG